MRVNLRSRDLLAEDLNIIYQFVNRDVILS
jgi:hypothetical protein